MKKIIKLFLLFVVLGGLLVFHYRTNASGEDSSLKDNISSNYKAYSLSSFNASKGKLIQYAEDLYQKELTEGETDKEFEGFTVAEYCWKALDEYDEELNVQKELALFLPLIAVLLLVVAAIASIRLGLSAIRKLDFNNDATSF